MSAPTSLYRAYAADGALLYVGISIHTLRRLQRHAEQSPWFSDMARLTVESFPTRQSAMDAERAAIKAERPAHNVVHNSIEEDATVSSNARKAPPRPSAPPSDAAAAPATLVGMAFHIFGTHRKPTYQGHITGLAEPGFAIVQFFEWAMGSPNTCALVPLAEIAAGCARPWRSEGAWILHRDVEAMVDWYDARASAWERETA